MIDHDQVCDIVNAMEVASSLLNSNNENNFKPYLTGMYSHPVLLFKNGRIDFRKETIDISLKSKHNLNKSCNDYEDKYKNQLINSSHYKGSMFYIGHMTFNYNDKNLEAIKELVNMFVY